MAVGVVWSQSSAPPKAEPAPARANEIQAALKTGRPVVLVVQPSNPDETSEAYGDWASYLNQFVKLSRARYSDIVTTPKLKAGYNTLFLGEAGNALLYRGRILEPDVYSIGEAYMAGKREGLPRDGLEEVKLLLAH